MRIATNIYDRDYGYVTVTYSWLLTLVKAKTSLCCYGCAKSLATLSSADISYNLFDYHINSTKGKGLPRQAEVAQVVPGSLRPRIFLTSGTTGVVGRQPYAPAAFTPG